MAKGPCLYSEIGKLARDLLFKDYENDIKFTITNRTSPGVELTSTGIRKGDIFLVDFSSKLSHNNITADVKADSNLNATITVDEFVPGLKAVCSLIYPDLKSSKVELQYQHDYAGITTSIGLTKSPVINYSVLFGNKLISGGSDVSFDTASGNFIKYNAALNVTYADYHGSLALNDKGDTLNGSCYCIPNSLANTAVGAELSVRFSSNEKVLTVGGLHAVDPKCLYKVRLNNYGLAGALIRYDWSPEARLFLVGEIDIGAIKNSLKVGFTVALKP